ncbi:MAG: hypothetical protein EA344_06515 [Alkalicoccus sp.]|nr:MAG: hypothetical protein EA344_06515 [Alkalicoccus sp.]
MILVVIGLLLFVNGLKRKSQLLLFFGSICLIVPSLYFIGIQTWFVLLPLVPAVAWLISYFVTKYISFIYKFIKELALINKTIRWLIVISLIIATTPINFINNNSNTTAHYGAPFGWITRTGTGDVVNYNPDFLGLALNILIFYVLVKYVEKIYKRYQNRKSKSLV